MTHNETDPKGRLRGLTTSMLIGELKADLARSRDVRWTSRMRAQAEARVDVAIDELWRRFQLTRSIPDHVIEALKTAAPYGAVRMDVDGPAEFVSGWKGEDERECLVDEEKAKADDLSKWVDVLQGRLSAQTERGDELAKRLDAMEVQVRILDGIVKAHEPVLTKAAKLATESELRHRVFSDWSDATAERLHRLEKVIGVVRNA